MTPLMAADAALVSDRPAGTVFDRSTVVVAAG
jgi:hypothetical protein